MKTDLGVREKALGLFKYCPVCKTDLKERTVYDILILGLACSDHHHFFIPLESVPPNQHEGQYLELRSEFKHRDDIAKDWLHNIALRKHLNQQVAEVLRLFFEIKENMYNRVKQEQGARAGVDHFCVICGENLEVSDQDGYQVGKNCTNKHKFWYRGPRLVHYTEQKDRLELSLDLSFDTLRGLVRSFTTRTEWERMIAPQVREILRHYADEFLEDKPTS